MKRIRTLLFACLMFPSIVFSASCTHDMEEELSRLASYLFSACLTEFSLQHYQGKQVDYNVKLCANKINGDMKKYNDVCDEGASYSEMIVALYGLCKLSLMESRIDGPSRLGGQLALADKDDREMCFSSVMGATKNRIKNELDNSTLRKSSRK